MLLRVQPTNKKAATLGVAASRRVPTLVEVHGKDMNWSLYEEQTGRFKAWLSKPFNSERASNAVQSTEAIRKVEFSVRVSLRRALPEQLDCPLVALGTPSPKRKQSPSPFIASAWP